MQRRILIWVGGCSFQTRRGLSIKAGCLFFQTSTHPAISAPTEGFSGVSVRSKPKSDGARAWRCVSTVVALLATAGLCWIHVRCVDATFACSCLGMWAWRFPLLGVERHGETRVLRGLIWHSQKLDQTYEKAASHSCPLRTPCLSSPAGG